MLPNLFSVSIFFFPVLKRLCQHSVFHVYDCLHVAKNIEKRVLTIEVQVHVFP